MGSGEPELRGLGFKAGERACIHARVLRLDGLVLVFMAAAAREAVHVHVRRLGIIEVDLVGKGRVR